MRNKRFTNQIPMALFPDSGGNMSKLETQFWHFHTKNPAVYGLLVKYALQYRERRGFDAILGIAVLYERVRWDVVVDTGDKDFKLNNNHRAYYARLIMRQETLLKDIFKLRKQRIQSTLGPPNDTLPSSEHSTKDEVTNADVK
jgi:hypothetical protein